MSKLSMFCGATVCILALAGVALADVKVTFDHNDADHATPEFKFKTVPSPSKANAAINASFAIVDAVKDDKSGDVKVLHDGKLPTGPDEPASNFFFKAGSEGGRISVDLGTIIDLKQVNTYSWHAGKRAPQVYSLYAANGAAADFNQSPANTIDPEACGWKLIAKVDTRPESGAPGGQYGVSISDSRGSLGKFRHLLIVALRAESDDDLGNTYFSAVDVIEARELLGNPVASEDRPGVKLVKIEGGKYTATIDTTETPDLTDWAEKELAPVVVMWYPKIVKMLPSEGYSAPTHFSITFRADKKGVADTGGSRINCAAGWFRENLKGEAKGAMVHEMVHVVQRYGASKAPNRRANPNPGWLVEGLADYVRWFQYEPTSRGAAISRRGAANVKYSDSYRVTANFLDWAVRKYDKNLIREIDAVMREGTYSDDIWNKLAGKTAQDLGDEWKADLAGRGATTRTATAAPN